MRVLCTICARGGSKGLVNKNLRKIKNKHLIYYTINQAKKSKFFDKIILSTDSKKIQQVSKKYGLESYFLRSKSLSNSKIGKVPVIKDALIKAEKIFKTNFDYIVDLDVTSPLRLVSDIKKGFKKIINENSDILFSVNKTRVDPYFNSVEMKSDKSFRPIKSLGNKIKRRQDSPKVYDLNACFYIWKRQALLKYDTLYIKKNSIYVMPDNRGFDIDDEIDFKVVNYFMKNELYK